MRPCCGAHSRAKPYLPADDSSNEKSLIDEQLSSSTADLSRALEKTALRYALNHVSSKISAAVAAAMR
jgi:hypothetical protein